MILLHFVWFVPTGNRVQTIPYFSCLFFLLLPSNTSRESSRKSSSEFLFGGVSPYLNISSSSQESRAR